ncbi:hypothetical protein SELR_19280 [Selenomonas ruminantium subsp. lactilytica TAM6421]|uniref:SGNH hydrolase-type esterase domain-containing protein n=1 Tax=Selenomonas ruminantium subsp. lactilytica (strain NBRC 103574 / TAM6421) TaxID=927704 RepID=I0GS99_SELRL|nr:SGNH/GDSL hydrolase family protein [Selenomonas ruminantium]BAL83636.1 hypothetical protein SELR_19280 [Selenomonas ruminantium subsp. lactilytica TAM6421]
MYFKRFATLAAAMCLWQSSCLAGAIAPTPLISRDIPAYTSAEPAKTIHDSNYRTIWRGEAPGYVAFDLSSLPAARRQQLALVWYSDSYDYDPTIKNRPSYGLLKNYTIEINKAPGGKLPTKGWQKLVEVNDNPHHSRQHILNTIDANWIRLHFDRVDNAGGKNASINVDIHDVSGGLADDWIIYGDSITAGWGNYSSSPYGPAGQLVNAANPMYYPILECGGTGSITSQDGREKIQDWLKVFPGHYVGLAFGTNDAWGHSNNMEQFADNMNEIVKTITAAGKVPVIAKIPWSSEKAVADNAPAYNAKIDELYAKNHAVIPGPDFWNIFKDKRELLSPDGVHPSPKGYGIMRAAWAKTMLEQPREGWSQELTPELAKEAAKK